MNVASLAWSRIGHCHCKWSSSQRSHPWCVLGNPSISRAFINEAVPVRGLPRHRMGGLSSGLTGRTSPPSGKIDRRVSTVPAGLDSSVGVEAIITKLICMFLSWTSHIQYSARYERVVRDVVAFNVGSASSSEHGLDRLSKCHKVETILRPMLSTSVL